MGNGERTGNMDIVTLAMNLYSQGIDPELDLSRPDEILNVYQRCTGLPVHPRHPWVGELVYTAFSGSHQDAIRKCLHSQHPDEPWQVAYLPIDPRDIGRDYQAVIRVNSQSGKGGVAYVLERDYGLMLPRWIQVELALRVQRLCEAQAGEIDSAAIYRLFQKHFVADSQPLRLDGYRLDRQSGQEMIEAHITDAGRARIIDGRGEGAVSAFIDAYSCAFGRRIRVLDYAEHAIGEGTDAEAVAYVLLDVEGERIAGAAFDHDTLSATFKSVLSALNLAQRQRRAA